MVAMSLFNKFKGKPAIERESIYFEDGTQTIIETAQF
jgi:hypothetical protein